MNDWYYTDARNDQNYPAPNDAEVNAANIEQYRKKTDDFINLIKQCFPEAMGLTLAREIVPSSIQMSTIDNSSKTIKDIPLIVLIKDFEKLRNAHIEALETYFSKSSKIANGFKFPLFPEIKDHIFIPSPIPKIEESIKKIENKFYITQRDLLGTIDSFKYNVRTMYRFNDDPALKSCYNDLINKKIESSELDVKTSLHASIEDMVYEIAKFSRPEKDVGETTFSQKHIARDR